MPQQLTINGEVKRLINNYHESPKTESKSETGSFKLTASQKIALKSIAKKEGKGVSQLVSDSIELYLSLLPHGDVLVENMDVIKPMLKGYGNFFWFARYTRCDLVLPGYTKVYKCIQKYTKTAIRYT